MLAKVLFTAVAKPDSELLGNFVFLLFGELVVKGEGFFSLVAAGSISVSIPESFSGSESAIGFFDEGFAF